ncbi:MAG: tRNA (adenosine(37)-N6)-threonylcarbamoyltransferase complex ATPase subunit type 1 TsaE [Deltaproteobacteria bacterium]|nr:tRNA (adenosine(37)-N6)-threonylcarbamoyltransferase complex ATPase subunit type 1 TsaE [Deltaproteobacteria bacterium]
MEHRLVSSPDEMHAVGVALGRLLGPGDVLGLVGELGAGKTVLVQGIGRGLGVPDEVPITSPTFTLINEYLGGRMPLFHVDLYRLSREEELEHVGLCDLYRGEGVVAVEWFDRFPSHAPAEYLEVRLEIVSGEERRLRFTPHGTRALELASRLFG